MHVGRREFPLTDDQGYGDLSCHGNPVLKTPAMDGLHGQSVCFTQFHSAPMCTPTRGQLLSGQDACHNGATSVTAGRSLLRRGIPTMADVFFGKWHLGDAYPFRPMDRGFQEAIYFRGYGLYSAPEFGNDYFDARYLDKGVPKRFEGYCTDFWFSEAMKWMGARGKERKPFFCYLPTNAPHSPSWVDPKYSAPYKHVGPAADHFGMLANLDENLGKLEAFLEQSGLRENTILIFMSDNGSYATDNGATGGYGVCNAGMRGYKTLPYEGGHRVLSFLRWPAGKLRAPGDEATPAQMQDLLPTLIDLCGLDRPAKAEFDGASLAGLLKNKQPLPDRMMVVQYGQIIRKWESSCIISGKWRMVEGAELYDLDADPGQQADVAAKNPAVLKKMRDHYERWWGRAEPGLSEFEPLSIGAEQENPVVLTSSDWQDIYADNPMTVLNAGGGPKGGPWGVLVERPGDYEIALSRWPFDRNLPLNAACPEIKLTAGTLPRGKALPIARARLTIAGQEKSLDTAAADQAAVFRVTLKVGTKTKLHGWFQDAAGQDLCGAFYAQVRRL